MRAFSQIVPINTCPETLRLLRSKVLQLIVFNFSRPVSKIQQMRYFNLCNYPDLALIKTYSSSSHGDNFYKPVLVCCKGLLY